MSAAASEGCNCFFFADFNNVSQTFHLSNFKSISQKFSQTTDQYLFLFQFNYFTKFCFKDFNFLADCSGLIPEREGMPPLCQQQPKQVTITWRFWSITTTTTNTMLIIIIIIKIIIILMSKIQFPLHIHKKDLLFFPTPTEVLFNAKNSPRFYSSEIHLSAQSL